MVNAPCVHHLLQIWEVHVEIRRCNDALSCENTEISRETFPTEKVNVLTRLLAGPLDRFGCEVVAEGRFEDEDLHKSKQNGV